MISSVILKIVLTLSSVPMTPFRRIAIRMFNKTLLSYLFLFTFCFKPVGNRKNIVEITLKNKLITIYHFIDVFLGKNVQSPESPAHVLDRAGDSSD